MEGGGTLVVVAGAVGGALGAAAGVLEGVGRQVRSSGTMGRVARFFARLGGLCARPAVKGEASPEGYAPVPEAPPAETDALVASKRTGAKASPVSYGSSLDRVLSETVRDIAREADAEVQSKEPAAVPQAADAEAEVAPLLPAAEAAPSPAVAPSPEDLVASLSTSPYCPPASPAKPAAAPEAVQAEATAPAAAADPPKVVHFAAEVVAREEEHKTPNVPITSAVSGALSDQFKTPMGELAPSPEALLEEAAASPDLLLAEAPVGAAAAVADYLEYAKSASTQVAALMERSTNAVISSVSETLEKQAPVFAKKKKPHAPTPQQPTPSVFLTQKSAKALAKEARRAKKKHRGRTRAAHGVKKTVRAVR